MKSKAEVSRDETDKYLDDPEFYDFVNGEFDETAANATLEELAVFAFGDIETAIREYEKRGKAK